MTAVINYFPTGLATSTTQGYLSADDFNKLAMVPVGSLTSASFMSAVIDFAATSTGNVVIPSLPGYYFQPTRIVPINKTTSGSVTTGPTVKIGNNGSIDNVCVGAANLPIGAVHGAGPLTTSTMAINANGPYVDLTTALTASVTVAASGVAPVWLARILLIGQLMRTADI
jgi:hypothetical protein